MRGRGGRWEGAGGGHSDCFIMQEDEVAMSFTIFCMLTVSLNNQVAVKFEFIGALKKKTYK
jgi:hypothetical protein